LLLQRVEPSADWLASNAKKTATEVAVWFPLFFASKNALHPLINQAPWREWRLLGYPALQHSLPIVIEMTN